MTTAPQAALLLICALTGVITFAIGYACAEAKWRKAIARFNYFLESIAQGFNDRGCPSEECAVRLIKEHLEEKL